MEYADFLLQPAKNRYKHTAIITMKIILTSCCLCNEITYIFELIIFMGSLCIWTSFYPPGRLKRLFLVLEPEYCPLLSFILYLIFFSAVFLVLICFSAGIMVWMYLKKLFAIEPFLFFLLTVLTIIYH